MYIQGIPWFDTRLVPCGRGLLVPRRAGVARLEASFATRLPAAGYTRGAVASGAPGAGGCWGIDQVHTLRWCRLGCGVLASGLPGAWHRLGSVGQAGATAGVQPRLPGTGTGLPVGGLYRLVQPFLAVFARL